MNKISSILNQFQAITLDELNAVQLLNRMDSKYILPISLLPKILNEIKENQFILEIEHHRFFNYETDYFDTEDFQFYKDHHNGYINRVKVRCRKYLENNLHFYEIKRKLFGTRTDKTRKVIATLPEELEENQYDEINYKRLENKPLIKTISNKFKRITLCNKNFTERISIDFDISFLNQKGDIVHLDYLSIIEVKQSKVDVMSGTIQILKRNKIYPSGFSKYSLGVALLEKNIKHNNFKPQLLKLEKIKNAEHN
ncbi:MAG: VTC domain-containing protein [Chitinophagaceae bacterium]|nr:VTC domain-containing protein [Chitinophagaceae bacterium]